ncbi:MAG TPA: DUF222 domain-containing protein [Iamia sp.]|nr:DUF222 domain-containing protein [Iamia sp.]
MRSAIETHSEWEVHQAFEAAVASAAGVRNAADAALVDLVVQALEEGWWEGWKIHTPAQWLMWQTGVSRSTASRVVALARRAPDLPTVMATFRRGGLSLDQAATVARYTPAEYEASVCELAVNATVNQIVAAARQYGFDAEIADRDQKDRSGPERSVTFGTDESDQWRASIRLPADEGQVVEEALKASRERLHDAQRAAAKARAEAEGRSASGTDADLGVAKISWADALVGVAHSVVNTDAVGAEVSSRPGVLVHLEVPVDDAETWRAEMHRGPALPPSMRRCLTCDGDIAAVWHTDGHPVQVGRTQRIVPRRTRRLVEHRDGGCRVPGCDSRLWIEVHHIVHWEDHGETVTWNLLCLCAHHHRLHHQGGLGITGNADAPDGITFTTATGRVLEPAGTPTRPPAMPAVRPYDGPTGETLHKHWVTFTRRPPCNRERDREPAA